MTSEVDLQQRIQTICLLTLAFFAAGIALYLLRTMLVPFVLAVFFTFILTPLINFQVRRLRLPRALALVDTLLLGVLAMALLAGVVASSVAPISTPVKSVEINTLSLELDKISLIRSAELGS